MLAFDPNEQLQFRESRLNVVTARMLAPWSKSALHPLQLEPLRLLLQRDHGRRGRTAYN